MPPSYSLSFVENFNHVSPPFLFIPVQTIGGWVYVARHNDKTLQELDELFDDDSIQGYYDTGTKKYYSHRSGYDFNKTINVPTRRGYYYYLRKAKSWDADRPSPSIAITLKNGWNLVGNTDRCSRTLSELKSSIGAGKVINIKYYDDAAKTWKGGDTDEVPSMKSFFVEVNADTIWSGKEVYVFSFVENFNNLDTPPSYSLSFVENFNNLDTPPSYSLSFVENFNNLDTPPSYSLSFVEPFDS